MTFEELLKECACGQMPLVLYNGEPDLPNEIHKIDTAKKAINEALKDF